MILTANGSKGHHKFTLEVVEKVKDDSILTNTTYVDYTFKISPLSSGWDWNSWGSRISYTITIGDNTYTGTIPAYDGSSTVTLKYANNIPIVHETDGTKTIEVGFDVSDSTGQNYTCGTASNSTTMALTTLHKAPEISQLQITAENNTKLTNITGFQNNVVVQYLSNKTFRITATTYDSATITKYEIYHNGVKIGESNTNTVNVNFASVGELQTTVYSYEVVPIVAKVIDSLGGVGEYSTGFSVIKYTKPTIQKTISTIKRKTGSGTVLTDNKCLLNFTGSIYKGDDIVGNANSQQLQYKIWNGTEPSYTNLSSTLNSGVVTKVDYEISNVLYTKSYDYKIKIKDAFIDSNTSDYVKSDRVATGKALWSEYKDRVDFAKLTIDSKEIYPNIYSSTETIIGIDNGNLRYRKEIDFGSLPTANITKSVAHNITNLSEVKKIEIIGYDGTNWFPIPFSAVNSMYSGTNASVRVDTTNINIASTSNWSSFTAKVTLEYIKS